MTDDTGQQDAIVIERVVDAPTDLVWEMWTDPEHFEQWYGPDGATIPVAELDVRVGGARLVCMEVQTPDGPMRMWFGGEHREVVVGERLVYSEFMSDEDGNVRRPAEMGMPEDHPTTTTVTVELHDLGGRTRVVVTHAGVPADSPGATGWVMALDALSAHLTALTGS